MAKRVKKYLLFMFGNWKSIEENQLVVSNIREVMETIIIGDEFSFVTGDNVIIMCLKSRLEFDEINNLLDEFFTTHITAFFLMIKPIEFGLICLMDHFIILNRLKII